MFTHLHCHSNYSFLEGASRIDELIARAGALGMSALALTDTNGLYGAVPFYKTALSAHIKPILGTELRADGSRIIFLARNSAGYGKLCRLITSFHLAGKKLPDGAGLQQSAGTENAFTPFLRALLTEGDPDLYTILHAGSLLRLRHASHIPHNLYLEIPGAAGAAAIARLARLAARLNLPPVATGPVLFSTPDGYEAHKLLTAIRTRSTIATIPPRELAPRDAYLRSGEEMCSLFAACPQAMENAGRIAADCNPEIPLGRFHLPRLTLPAGETAEERLRRLCLRGLAKRYRQPRQEARERLSHELEVITRLDFASYVLVVHDIVREARRRGIPIIGRGSAAGSIVSYCLEITHVDPIRHNLYFERFLNPERGTPPDIDLDFSWNRRDEILDYVYKKYGAEHVAMISTIVTFGARSAVREIGKAMGIAARDITRWTEVLPSTDAGSIRKAAVLLPECRGLPLGREPLRSIVRLAAAIDGYPRHLSVHTGGIVITPFPLSRIVPLEIAAKGIVVTQYEMRAAEEIGLVKIDLLGQRSLAVLEDALSSIRKNHGVRPPLEKFDTLFRDEATAALIRSGRTMGCFYIESPAMRQLLTRLDVTTYEELVAASSVIRPGVAESGMMRQYIDRHRGREKVTFLHPGMEEILADTHGVMIYQEDVMRVAHLIAGMTLAEADLLRRAMSGKMRSQETMAGLEKKFAEAARARGIAAETAAEIWRQIESFAGYAFCKAHSASFALLSFQVAFLKAHWPAEFMAAVLSNGGGFYQTQAYLDEARRLGLKILLPDINRSEVGYRAGPGWIRVGLMQVGELRRETMERLIATRRRDGFFTSLEDFYERAKPDRREAEQLIMCGAIDSLGLTRPAFLRKLHLLISQLPRRHCDTMSLPFADFPRPGSPPGPNQETRSRDFSLGSNDAAGGDGYTVMSSRHLSVGYDEETKDILERNILGVLATRHPLAAFMRATGSDGYIRADELTQHAGERVELLGWIVCMKRVRTSRGEYMRFVTMEDMTDLFEVVLFPRCYNRYGHLLKTPGPFAVRGHITDEQGCYVLNADRLHLLRFATEEQRD